MQVREPVLRSAFSKNAHPNYFILDTVLVRSPVCPMGPYHEINVYSSQWGEREREFVSLASYLTYRTGLTGFRWTLNETSLTQLLGVLSLSWHIFTVLPVISFMTNCHLRRWKCIISNWKTSYYDLNFNLHVWHNSNERLSRNFIDRQSDMLRFPFSQISEFIFLLRDG